MAVDRLRRCENVVVLSEELGVHRRLLYKWRKQLDSRENESRPAHDLREFTLGKEIYQLKRLRPATVGSAECNDERQRSLTTNLI